MSLIKAHLLTAAQQYPARIALEDGQSAMSYAELKLAVDEAAAQLQVLKFRALGLLADNGIAWAMADLSALSANTPLVPLPLFFSTNQLLHAIVDAGLDGLLTDRPERVLNLLQNAGVRCQLEQDLAGLHLIRLLDIVAKPLPAGTLKITYTSGTTGKAKGVCLSLSHMETVAVSLRDACEATTEDRHLCLTPLSTLLENIGGIYVPLLAGARVCLPPLSQVGLHGATQLDVAQMIKAMHTFEASSVILAPQMLHAMVVAGRSGMTMPPLRFAAVGGAPVSKHLLEQAAGLGIPAHEGYGLSECASVVALNTPQERRTGSVGRPLPHVELSFAEDGEILVETVDFLGYLGEPSPQQPWPTGDLGYLDAEGFLHLTGRKKSMFITSFGRNVAPEWAERELTLHLAIAQAAVFGEARPFNVAVIVPRPGFSDEDIEVAIELANRSLPDYASISAWAPASEAFSLQNGQLTTNGRLRREAIASAYSNIIKRFYEELAHGVF